MARQDGFPELPPEFPDGYIPFIFRVDVGEWWKYDNTSNFWCCNEGGISMEAWFYLDMWFLIYLLMEYGQFECPIDAETSFWIWDECYENTAFKFDVSTVTDSGSGISIMAGGQFKEMVLEIAANSETYEPYIWMQSGNGMCFATDNDNEDEIRFFSSDTTVNTGLGEGYYFGFGIDSSPTPGIQDSIISSTPMSSPSNFDRNIYLKPSEYGKVKFGEYKITQSAKITGYIEIVDKNGKNIKLAVIDYDDSYQEQYQPPM